MDSLPNKRPMGHIAHPKTSSNLFEQSYDYICVTFWPSSSEGDLKIEISLVVQEEKISKFRKLIYSNFVIISLWEKGVAMKSEKKNLNSSSPKDAFCQVWLKLAQWFFSRKSFKFCQCILANSSSSAIGKGRRPSFDQT